MVVMGRKEVECLISRAVCDIWSWRPSLGWPVRCFVAMSPEREMRLEVTLSIDFQTHFLWMTRKSGLKIMFIYLAMLYRRSHKPELFHLLSRWHHVSLA